MICRRDPSTPFSKILSLRVLGALAVVVLITIMLLRLEVVDLARHTNQVAAPKPAAPLSSSAPSPAEAPLPAASSVPPPPPPPPPITYLHRNQDETTSTSPFNIKDFCNKVPAPRHLRGLLISKPKDQPTVIFIWRQATFESYIDWEKESRTLCPIPLSLQLFFDHYRQKRTGYTQPWENGYAPCIFWTLSFNSFNDERGSCNTPTNGNMTYVLTSNYTQFEEADIVLFNFPYFEGTSDPPYFDTQYMPPRIAHQNWVFQFQGESVGYYPHTALPAYLQQFDLTIGTPPTMDIHAPYYEVTPKIALSYANIKPGYPFDKTPEHYVSLMVRNCGAKNDRNGLIDAVISGLNAHSYGVCRNNIQIPDEINRPGKSWVAIKQETLAGYPFVLAAENSNCIGYISEKIYDALAVGAIPIYMGAPDIAKYVPEGSYISVADFRDYDELVQYVKTVDRAQFYKWKEVVKKDPSKFCSGCMVSHRKPECIMMDNVHYV
ncbi:unnamed protein product [Mortierella alpina]